MAEQLEKQDSDSIQDSSGLVEEYNLDDPKYYINRELTMLEFQRRVLQEARDETNPLLERVKFLAILGSNLDEFFMVRVSGLIKQVDAGVIEVPPDGLTPAEQLAAIRKVAWNLMSEAREILQVELMPQLKKAGIYLLEYLELNDRQKAVADQYFSDMVFPILTPLAFDPGHPFPHISNLSLNLAVVIRDNEGQERFARVKIPDTLPRLVPLRRSAGGLRKDGTRPKIIILSGWIKLSRQTWGHYFRGWIFLKPIYFESRVTLISLSKSWRQKIYSSPWSRAFASADSERSYGSRLTAVCHLASARFWLKTLKLSTRRSTHWMVLWG